MSTPKWSPFELNLPVGLEELVPYLRDLIWSLNNFLDVVKAGLELAKTLAGLAATNPVEAILKALIEQIEAILDGLTKATGMHAIFIPIEKQLFNFDANLALDVTSGDVTSTFNDLESGGAFADETDIDSEIITFINTSPNAIGGNRGFWRTLKRSTLDENDFNRPQFTDDFAVTGICLMFGSETINGLQAIFDFIMMLLKLGSRSNLDHNSRPVVHNLKTRTVPISDESPARIGIQLDWDSVPPVSNFSIFGSDETTLNKEIIIVRSTSPTLREKIAWNQLFSLTADQLGTNDQPESGDAKVIARIRNEGLIRRYIDRDPSLREDQIYYYTATILYTMEAKGTSLAAQYSKHILQNKHLGPLSNVVRAQYVRPVETKKGEPPDWHATPSLIKLFPTIEGFVNEIKLALAALTSITVSESGMLSLIKQTIAQIDQLVNDGEAVLNELERLADDLEKLKEASDLGIYITSYNVKSGGMNGWLGELAKRLSNQEDDSRPPFDDDELVAGFALVAGAPNFSGLAEIETMLELFFGKSSTADEITDSEGRVVLTKENRNPLLEALDELDSLLPDPEISDFKFGENMEITETEEVKTAKLHFNDQMQPVDPLEISPTTVVCDK